MLYEHYNTTQLEVNLPTTDPSHNKNLKGIFNDNKNSCNSKCSRVCKT